MRRTLYFVVAGTLALVVAWVGVRLLPQWTRIPDVTRPIELTLQARPGQDHIYSLDVVGIGSVDGDADICLVLNGSAYKPVRLHGRVRFVWGGDWYSPTATVRYIPVQVKSGSVLLRYRFNSL